MTLSTHCMYVCMYLQNACVRVGECVYMHTCMHVCAGEYTYVN